MSSIVKIPTRSGVTIAVSDGIAYPLTPCCGASAKGLEHYVGCRACYQEIDPSLGMACGADEVEQWINDWWGGRALAGALPTNRETPSIV